MKQKLQPGDIIFSRKNGPMSLFIRWMQRPTVYSHTCLVGIPTNTVFTTGFGGKGKKTMVFLPASEFRQLPMTDYLANKQYEIRRYKDLSTKQKGEIIKWCQGQLGQKYPFRKTFILLIMLLRGKRIDKISTQPSQQHCYELVAKAYKVAGIELNPRAGNLASSGYNVKEIYLSPRLKSIR